MAFTRLDVMLENLNLFLLSRKNVIKVLAPTLLHRVAPNGKSAFFAQKKKKGKKKKRKKEKKKKNVIKTGKASESRNLACCAARSFSPDYSKLFIIILCTIYIISIFRGFLLFFSFFPDTTDLQISRRTFPPRGTPRGCPAWGLERSSGRL
jgi:hypothetical protein